MDGRIVEPVGDLWIVFKYGLEEHEEGSSFGHGDSVLSQSGQFLEILIKFDEDKHLF